MEWGEADDVSATHHCWRHKCVAPGRAHPGGACRVHLNESSSTWDIYKWREPQQTCIVNLSAVDSYLCNKQAGEWMIEWQTERSHNLRLVSGGYKINNNNCIWYDTKAASRRSPNCIRKTKYKQVRQWNWHKPAIRIPNSFSTGTDFSVSTGRVKKLYTLLVSLYF